jgi:hypothetical protein
MTDLTVSFGANLSDLNSKIAEAAANTKAFSGTMATAAAAPNAAFDKLKASLDATTAATAQNTAAAAASKTSWLEVAGGVLAGEAAFALLSKAAQLAREGAATTGNDFLTYGKQLIDLWGKEITGARVLASAIIDNYGSMKRAAEVFLFGEKAVAEAEAKNAAAAAAAKSALSWKDYFASFVLGKENILAWNAAAAAAKAREEALSTSLVEGSAKALAAAGTMKGLAESFKEAGSATGTEGLRALIEKLQEIPGISAEDAVAIQNVVGSISGYSATLGETLNDVIVRQAQTAEEAKKLADALKKAFDDPTANGAQFIANLGDMGIALKEQFETAKQTNNLNEMRGAILDALNAKEQNIAAEGLRRLQEKGDAETAENRKALEAVQKMQQAGKSITFFDFLGISAGVEKMTADMIAAVGPTQETAAAIKAAADNLERLRQNGVEAVESLRNLPQTDEQVFAAAKPIIANARPQIDQIDEITAKLRVLYEEKQRLQTGASPFGALATPENIRELERNKEATDDLEDSLRKLQERRKGGSAVDLLANLQAEEAAKFTLNESAAAYARAAALDQEAASTKNLVEAGNLAKRAAEEREKGAKLASDEKVAQFKREAAAAETGSAEELAATLRANAAKRAVTPPGAERISLDAADEAAERKHQDALNADAKAGEDARFRIKQEGLAGDALLIREEAQEEKIGRETEKADLLANLSAQEAAQREHYARIEEIFHRGTSQFREAQKKIEEIAAESGLKRVAIERQIDQQIAATQKQAFDQTASTFSQAITGMITNQTRLRDAARQVTAQILASYIQAGIKLVLENTSVVGQTVAAVVTGEAAKTAAVTAGTALRTGAEATGAAASNAATFASIIKSIGASAAETFAGIFGFLSPVLGPAAAVPAGIGEAQVLAVGATVPKLASGAWSLPSDMLANVHQGEMIIPPDQSSAFRDMLAHGGGAPNITIHNHAAGVNVEPQVTGNDVLLMVTSAIKQNNRGLPGILRDRQNRAAH